MARSCEICTDQESKYKCPTCCIPYCSVPCYKNHLENCLPKEDSAQPGNGKATYEHKFPTKDTVPIDTLDKLKENKDLVNLLKNPHLQDFLKTVDSADNPGRLMRKAMKEPLFLEFVDECMKVVAPNQQEITDQQILDTFQASIEGEGED